ncbi:MAG: hypothetical protein K2I96_12250 [Lachnospiraceae bacterium]|nr:hypothetical protein [Lachnospiraceae bacterium]
MYIMRKMNREKKAATEAERAALLADGYRDMTPPPLHGDLPAGEGDPVLREPEKKEKKPVGKNPDKTRSPVKKVKAADTKQEEPAKVSGSDRQEPVEKEGSIVPDSAEAADPVQKENIREAAAPEAQLSAETDGPVQEQPAGQTDSAQQPPEETQNPD